MGKTKHIPKQRNTNSDAMNTKMMQVTVPKGVTAGDSLQVETPMGTVQVTVPEHLEAGDTFMVAMPQPQTSTLPVEGIHLLKMQVSKARATTPLGMAVRHSDPVPVVREVSGLASSAGIKPGDTIVSVNGKLVADTSHCLRLLRSATGTVAIEVQ